MSFDYLMNAFILIFSNPSSLLFIIVGVTAGIIVGCLPGLTATMGCALLIPFTYSLPPVEGLLLLMGIFSGGIYGGSISGILIRTPGTPAAATLLDGYPLSQRGEGGKAIGISTIASFIGGTIGALIMAFLAPEIASFGLRFGPPEFFALAVFGLTMIISISGESLLRGAIVVLIGLLLTTIGFDPLSGVPRFSFENEDLLGGITFIPVLIGLFGFAQVFRNVENMEIVPQVKSKVGKILPKISEIKPLLFTMFKSGSLGSFLGSVPGLGSDVAAFVAYGEAKRTSKEPEKFGKGSHEGIAAPESANNGATGGAMIPMLTLGVPGDAVTAVLLGALTIHGLQPGPLLFRDHIDIVYPIFAGMILCQVVLLIIGLGGARIFSKLININQNILTPVIFLLCITGAYAIRFSFFDVGLAFIVGVIAYFMDKAKFPISPILLALILGPMAEQNMRRSLLLSRDDFMIFIERPISAVFLGLALIMLVSSYRKFKKLRSIEKEIEEKTS
ncbi:tripartite tricarboxylate transporter permease [Poseidonibacter ostreae]|uniref:C4-dicarboxylate ABC transporter permease n=1 Tax=Poseidonibacter ostreae TaxID=2654171 RepID=A0A6L4WVC9_9BACT|nr:tripartite tricarboxylate transporter permease [Poseidonibacter ostreae]KAB7886846.1 C4-dicarboxylate ABC transporter permease [Poseidonibacter ostreae]KAB7890489.1 C4-dicarboxylate ABC transporter permease [Poseidonibacter ostreae]KAB7890918.1 C4-dicarboxylate ABC transporter permease [Poseidonibacter ostreae]